MSASLNFAFNICSDNDEYLLEPQFIEDEGRQTLILDLDETLIHALPPGQEPPPHLESIEVEYPKNSIKVLKRPGLTEFLDKIKDLFEVLIWTASSQEYADPIINAIDPTNIVAHRLYRQDCTIYKEKRRSSVSYNKSPELNCLKIDSIKELNRLGRDVKRCFIVDDKEISYSKNADRGIPIKAWVEDENDRELERVFQVLRGLHDPLPKVE